MFASVEVQQDRDAISCDRHVTKAAKDCVSVVPDVFCFHIGVGSGGAEGARAPTDFIY